MKLNRIINGFFFLLILSACSKQFSDNDSVTNSKTSGGGAVLPASHFFDQWIFRDYHSSGIGNADCVFVINGKAYVFGWGNVFENKPNELWEYDDNTITWVKKANFPGTHRVHAMAFAIGNKGYIACGSDFAGGPNFLNDLWEYNLTTNQWTQKANFPAGARNEGIAFSINGKGYVGMGGILTTCSKDLWEYNPGSDTWIQKNSLPGFARTGAFSFVVNNKAYVGTGKYYNQTTSPSIYANLKDLWEYNPLADSWTQKANYPGGVRTDVAAFSVGNNGYAGTGLDPVTGNAKKDFYGYNPASNSWTAWADYGGYTRWGAIGFSIGQYGFIGFGETSSGNGETALWRYLPY